MILAIAIGVLVYALLTRKYFRYNEQGLQRDEDGSIPIHFHYTTGKWHVSRAVGIHRAGREFGLAYRPIVAFFKEDDILLVEFGYGAFSSVVVLFRPQFPFVKFRLRRDIGL
jgi:hypothetical protein